MSGNSLERASAAFEVEVMLFAVRQIAGTGGDGAFAELAGLIGHFLGKMAWHIGVPLFKELQSWLAEVLVLFKPKGFEMAQVGQDEEFFLHVYSFVNGRVTFTRHKDKSQVFLRFPDRKSVV